MAFNAHYVHLFCSRKCQDFPVMPMVSWWKLHKYINISFCLFRWFTKGRESKGCKHNLLTNHQYLRSHQFFSRLITHSIALIILRINSWAMCLTSGSS